MTKPKTSRNAEYVAGHRAGFMAGHAQACRQMKAVVRDMREGAAAIRGGADPASLPPQPAIRADYEGRDRV